MKKLTYITGNYGKYIQVKERFEKAGISIDYYKCDLDEPEINDVKVISKEKARQAYKITKRPVFVADTGFYIEDYPGNPGYPGALVKRSGISTNVGKLLEVMKNTENRKCYFLDCLTFFDGKDYYQFLGNSKGTLANEIRGNENKKAKSNLWYVFVPDNCSKTLAEMSDDERENRKDGRTSAINEFIKWYSNDYKKCPFVLNQDKKTVPLSGTFS